MAVLITHPGRQHSHQAALALQRTQLLAAYWSGVPATAADLARLPAAMRRRMSYAPVAVEPARARAAPWCPGMRRLGDRMLPAGAARFNDFAACRLFDRWVARRLPGVAAQAVLACEISARSTFLMARKSGVLAILDAPSIHHGAQDRWHGTLDSPGLHRRITRIKDEEIALADHLVTVSELARETYLAAGVAAEKVHAVPLGADLELFQPPADRDAPAGTEPDAFVFLFAGATSHRKGFDLLLAAFAGVAASDPAARLRVVGPAGDSAALLARYDDLPITVAGPTDQRGLAAEFQNAQCLVLPSRNDSYGMVVAEALACGLPVLISDQVGAKDLVVAGDNGWIVPAGDQAALTARMLRCVRERDALRRMREACRRSAQAASWEGYHQRFAELMRSLLERGRR